MRWPRVRRGARGPAHEPRFRRFRPDRPLGLAIFFFACFAVYLRAAEFGDHFPSPWDDTGAAIAYRTFEFEPRMTLLGRLDQISGYPLPWEILQLCLARMSDLEIVHALPSVVASVVLVYSFALLGAEVGGAAAAFLGAFVVSVGAYPVLHGEIPRPYQCSLLFVTLATIHALRYLREPAVRHLVPYAWSALAAVCTNLTAVLPVAAMAPVLALREHRAAKYGVPRRVVVVHVFVASTLGAVLLLGKIGAPELRKLTPTATALVAISSAGAELRPTWMNLVSLSNGFLLDAPARGGASSEEIARWLLPVVSLGGVVLLARRSPALLLLTAAPIAATALASALGLWTFGVHRYCYPLLPFLLVPTFYLVGRLRRPWAGGGMVAILCVSLVLNLRHATLDLSDRRNHRTAEIARDYLRYRQSDFLLFLEKVREEVAPGALVVVGRQILWFVWYSYRFRGQELSMGSPVVRECEQHLLLFPDVFIETEVSPIRERTREPVRRCVREALATHALDPEARLWILASSSGEYDWDALAKQWCPDMSVFRRGSYVGIGLPRRCADKIPARG